MIESMTATNQNEVLEVVWETGEETRLPAALLRQEAKDAWSLRERIEHGEVKVLPGIQITGLFQMGATGVNVHFSDGHDKAIYPFFFLRELSERFDK